ncbi:MAG: hypothetical protein ACSLE2_00430 [Lysobacterales bacterium]
MARPRRGKRRRERGRDWLQDYLLTGVPPDDDDPEVDPFDVVNLCYDTRDRREAWESLREQIMGAWKLPGCRPFAWWVYDAPRLPLGTFPNCYYDGTLPEPRRHLSGPGRPLHEALNYVPAQRFGIWQWYGDPDDPPAFESQFAYLDRLGLLLPGEVEPIPEPHPHPAQIEDAAAWAKVPT